ncbi:unnamed protein product [Cunninghamella blakesleeana]
MKNNIIENQYINNITWQPQGNFALISDKNDIKIYSSENTMTINTPYGIQTFNKELNKKNDEPILQQLENDIGNIMRKRVLKGYFMNGKQNKAIIKNNRQLEEIWSWIENAIEATNKTGQFNNMDYQLRGIYNIWIGTQGRKSSPSSTPRPENSLSSPKTKLPMNTKPSSPDIDALNKNALYIIPTTLKLDQRRYALSICGFNITKDELEQKINNLELNGEHDKAAAWSVFNGQIDRAIQTLSNNQLDQQHKLMSAILAGYLSNSNKEEPNHLWEQLCQSLSQDLSNQPYLKAIFSYIATSQWEPVLMDDTIPLNERLIIALRFLDDDQLTMYLVRLMDIMIADGNISGLILTGLSTTRGIDLLERMVNISGDIQTAALLVSFVLPRRIQDARAEEWIERWQLWHSRAKFDIERGKYLNASEDIASPQIYVRCTYCAQTLGHSLLAQNLRSRDGKRMNVQANISPSGGGRISGKQKATVCPSCRKPLPRCALCLLHMGTPIDSTRQAMVANDSNQDPANFDLWFTWCQTCRHGGHAIHMLDWFQNHTSCPVSNCNCQCQIFTE